MNRALVIFYGFLLIILFIRFYFFFSNQKAYHTGEEVNFETQVLTDPKVYSNYQTLFVNIDPLQKVLLRLPVFPPIYYGDKIQVTGNLKILVLSNNDTIFTINNPKIKAVSRENNPFLAAVYSMRQKIIHNFRNILDPVSAPLLLGIVFGIKDNLPKDFSNQIQITGVTHVIAASGMNVTMFSGFLFTFFSLIFKRQLAIILSILGILFYTVLAGLQASIIRAAIMGIIVFTAQILGKAQYALLTLFITGFVMLFFVPTYIFDTGFQLSFAATLGLLYIPRILIRFKNSFTDVFITTISAQIATLPILIVNFGNYSIFSIITNGLVLWTIPLLMILGSFAAILSLIYAPISNIFLYLCLPFLIYFEKTVEFFASFGSTFNVSNLPWQFSIAYYLFFLSFLIFKYRRKP